MCGICGKLNFDSQAPVPPGLLRQMLGTIRHRGPDGEGTYTSGPVGMGHCRLSIIDVDSGQQPLCNEDGSVWIVFNGEIYNFQDLRVDLIARGHRFKTNCDTEVIVHCYEEHGEHCLQYLRGMFSFAIWDNRNKALFLARDRIGIKPLYYHLGPKAISFGSEIKAVLEDSDITAEVNPVMIDRFLTHFYLPGEDTLFRNVRRLPAGSYMMVRNAKATIRPYWDLDFASPSSLSADAAEEQLLGMLDEVVRLHMISDVPVGFLLSGGIDSTAMLDFGSENSTRPLSTYTVGFSGAGVTDERPFARLAARVYGSEHHELTLTSDQFVTFLPEYVRYMEEPICEPPAVALFYIARLARQKVKVLISGEGGDEAFGGYSNYRNLLWFERIKAALKSTPQLLAISLGVATRLPGGSRLKKYGPLLDRRLEEYYYSRTSSPSQLFNSESERLYSRDFSRHVDKELSRSATTRYFARARTNDIVNRMLYVDTKTWLVDDLLMKADKMTMANSVELRVPLLDHKLLEFAASLPGNLKVRGTTTKYLAKKALAKRVPKQILQRKKIGFPVPYSAWLRTELKDWLASILLDPETVSRGYFEKSEIQRLIAANGQTGMYSKELFSLATLELLHREFLPASRRSAAVA